jgi:translation initiation factor IF-3
MRVLVDDGAGKDEMIGVMSKEDALAAAQERELDLVLINAKDDPVVCKIISYDKFRFAQEKRRKEQRKAASRSKSELKELKMSYKIGEHDYEVRKKQAVKFLSAGDKVKFSMLFKGREMTHSNVGKDVLMKMANELEEHGVLDNTPKVMGRTMIMMISPRPRNKDAASS